MSDTIRVLCVDDHAFLVDGLRSRFAMEADLECLGRLSTADELVSEVRRLRPDVVLLDIEMPGMDAFEAADDIRRSFPETRVAILSAYVRDRYLSAAVDSGCWGYFSKADEPDEIVAGVRKVASGEFALSPKVAERCRVKEGAAVGSGPVSPDTASSKLDSLTARELEVLRLIGRGLSRAEIAETLHRSPKTIDGHRERILAKLDLHSRVDLVRFAIREGVAEAE